MTQLNFKKCNCGAITWGGLHDRDCPANPKNPVPKEMTVTEIEPYADAMSKNVSEVRKNVIKAMGMKWQCGSCYYHNEPTDTSCFACGSRPVPQLPGYLNWQCVCGRVYDTSIYRDCPNCGRQKGP